MVSPNRAQEEAECPPMVRQGSLYNLSFDEAQSQLGNTGKPLHTMNLDELLKSVLSAESGQLVQNPSSDSFLIGNTDLNGTLSNKTLNEVWREIVPQGQVINRSGENNLQQSILGETTLQDFLARAGVINMGNDGQENDVMGDAQSLMAMDPIVMASQHEDWLPLQMQMQMPSIHIHQQQYQEQQIIGLCPDFSVSKSVYESPGYSENSMAISMPMVSPTCSDSRGASVVGRKHRYSDEMLEKTIERRQKRMAKNRESAARSRAKKQEHINKLQKDKSRLEKTNSWLKKLKEVNAQLFSATTVTPKYQLRRTSSTTF